MLSPHKKLYFCPVKSRFNLKKTLLIFFVGYLGLLLLYLGYLHYFNTVKNTVDPFTFVTAKNAAWAMSQLGFDTQAFHFNGKHYVWLYIEKEYATKVNEGCNAISIAILVIAFVTAFYTTKKQVCIYLIFSLIVLYIINILRIAWLSYIYRFQHDFFKVGHDWIFPSIVYGFVVVSWLVWMKYFVIPYNENYHYE